MTEHLLLDREVAPAQQEEEWRVVDGFPDYEVSSLGRARSNRRPLHPDYILRPGSDGRDYLNVNLCGDRGKRMVKLHVLVCTAFHGPRPSNKHQVAHRDGDGANCAANNLRWATSKENIADKRAHGTQLAKLSAETVAAILVSRETHEVLAKRYGVARTSIGKIQRGLTWRHVEGARQWRRSRVPPETRDAIRAARGTGKAHEIASYFGVGLSTVYQFWRQP